MSDQSSIDASNASLGSVGGANPASGGPQVDPNQPVQTTGAGTTSGADAQGVPTPEGQNAAENGQGQAAATAGHTVSPTTPGRLPSEDRGYTPAPARDTGEADNNGVPFTQATQRLVHPDEYGMVPHHMIAPVNIPPGSRPNTIDPKTGNPV